MSPFTATTKTPTTEEANNVKLGDNCSDDTAVTTVEDLAVAATNAPAATVFVFGKKMVAAMVLAMVVAVTFGAVALGQQAMIRRDVAAARQGLEAAVMSSQEKSDDVGNDGTAVKVAKTGDGDNLAGENSTSNEDEKADTGSSHRSMLLRPSQQRATQSSSCPRISGVGSGTSAFNAGKSCGANLSSKGCSSQCIVANAGRATGAYNSRTKRYTARCFCSS